MRLAREIEVRAFHAATIKMVPVPQGESRLRIGARDVVRVLEQFFTTREKPQVIRSDNGREFIAATVVDWLAEQGVTAAFIARGFSQQNCYVERVNGSMRDELLDGELFCSVLEARTVISAWVDSYKTARPYRGLA